MSIAKNFISELEEKAKKYQKTIVLPEGNESRMLEAAKLFISKGLGKLILLGDKADIEAKNYSSAKLNLDDEKIEIISPNNSIYHEDFCKTLYELRKEKGLSVEKAKELISDVSYFGTMLVYKGLCDGMVSGSVHTTAETMRPALQIIKTPPSIKTVSSVFFMLLKNQISLYADCAIIPNPTPAQLADIATACAKTAQAFNIEPRVAILSYSSGDSGVGPDVEKIKHAVDILHLRSPNFVFDGPIQYDAAVDAIVASKKMPSSSVAGVANVFVFPDLNSGNITYKAVQRETGCLAIGPILQGLKKPINDLSRGATVDDIYNTILVTAIQASNL